MNNKKIIIMLHVAVWVVLFVSPLMFVNHGNGITWQQFMTLGGVPLSIMIVFYANYFWLTPKYYAINKKKAFWIINIIMVLLVGIALHTWMEHSRTLLDKPHIHQADDNNYIFMILRDIFNLSIAAAIATTLQLSMRWQASENARREAESARVKAELKNLRSQINPHFLLNTLNNIYALTEFDPIKAQNAILELSKLLRHILYDNQQTFVNLKSEIHFLTNYINLMKLRLASNVEIRFNYQIPDPCNIKIAPLIFISLIENAFKHGVSANKESFIYISIRADESCIICQITNSNYPKGTKDNSGHGIGLKQVAGRLNLLYPNAYTWENGTDAEGKEYSSKIIIYDTKLCNN